MNKEEINIKLDAVLSRLGMDATAWSETISRFRAKLELLSATNNYNKLLKSLFASNDLSEFNSYVFEAMFAFDFESKKQSLKYEVTQLQDKNSSIDFYYELPDLKIYIELRLVQQRNEITKSIDAQLTVKKYSKILLNGNDETNETVRLQNLILRKCQKPDGTPNKFRTPVDGTLNFIAINVSELHLGMIDKSDCWLTLCGDRKVSPFCSGWVFGMWQNLLENSLEKEKKYYKKFEYFRKTIHGILFVRYAKDIGYLNKLYIDRELEYFAILNCNLLTQKIVDFVIGELGSFLPEWSNKNSKKLYN